ncbi:MAG: cytochrome c biogenesis CcdA family protein [Methylophilaceae bacterium]
MEFNLATYGLAGLAGVLSTLSPCVLPLIPILLASALAAHRFGAIALAGGLALSFTLVGVAVAAAGSAVGLDQDALRVTGSVLLIIFGLVLLLPVLQEKFAQATSRLSSSGQTMLAGITLEGLHGQFLLGLLLGLVWSPCVGPTLGAAITLASQGENLFKITGVMAVFGLGAAVPLVILGLISRPLMMRFRGKLMETGKRGKQILGLVLLLLGSAVLFGWDKLFEIWVLKLAPQWLVDLTTRF